MKRKKETPKPRIIKNFDSDWSILVVAFRILYQYIHFWIRINFRYLLTSIPILTIPTANIFLFSKIHETMLVEGIIVQKKELEVRSDRKPLYLRASLLALILFLALVTIIISIVFWTTRPENWLRFVSILSIYALVLLWMAFGYLSPTILFNRPLTIKEQLKLIFQPVMSKPFSVLFYRTVTTLLFILGSVLLGPILLVVPVARSLIIYLSYMHFIDNIEEINLSP